MILAIPDVLNAAELQQVDDALAQLQFVDGKITAGGAAARAKNNQQAQLGPAVRPLQKMIVQTLMKNEAFQNFALPLRIMPPLFNRYGSGQTYGDHIDRPVMHSPSPVRTDLAMTLFLSAPESYEGGELVVSSDFGPQRVKLARGSLILYPASTIHRVEPVTRGVRTAAVTWVQSMVRDLEKRQLLAELGGLKRWADQVSGDSPQSLQLQKVRANLLRWWADV